MEYGDVARVLGEKVEGVGDCKRRRGFFLVGVHGGGGNGGERTGPLYKPQ